MGWLILAFVLGFAFGPIGTLFLSEWDREDRRTFGWWYIAGMVILVFFGGMYLESALEAAAYGIGSGTVTGWITRWLIRYRESRRR
jgi:hypothetical protein